MKTIDSSAVLLLELPQAALAGIDLLSFTTTPRFKGVKNLPAGLHFAFAGTTTAFSERHGIWFDITSNGGDGSPLLVLTKWDARIEALVVETDETKILQWRGKLGTIWREGLTPYRQAATKSADDEEEESESSDWPTLTSYITAELLTRITGSVSRTWTFSSASSSRRDLEDIPGLTADDLNFETEKELKFLPINLKKTWREGATGRERTDAAQDRSWALNELIATYCTGENAMEIVGELQLCFLMVLTINNFSCLEQWKRILTLVFTCKSAVAGRPDFFISAIAALRLQLQHCKDAEGGLIDLADEGGSLLKNLLIRFRKGISTYPGIEVQDVVDELDDLEDYLRQEHGWQFGGNFAKTGMLELEDGEQIRMDTTAFDEDDETGEFAPQIVDLTPEQARLLGVQDEPDLPKSFERASLDELDGAEESEEDESSVSEDFEEDEDLETMDARY